MQIIDFMLIFIDKKTFDRSLLINSTYRKVLNVFCFSRKPIAGVKVRPR
jgi:hypothetical protein